MQRAIEGKSRKRWDATRQSADGLPWGGNAETDVSFQSLVNQEKEMYHNK